MLNQRPQQIIVWSRFIGYLDAPSFRISRIMVHRQTMNCCQEWNLISLLHHDPGSLRFWCIDSPDKSFPRVDSLVPLLRQDPDDLWSQSLIQIIPKEHPLLNVRKSSLWRVTLLPGTMFVHINRPLEAKVVHYWTRFSPWDGSCWDGLFRSAIQAYSKKR